MGQDKAQDAVDQAGPGLAGEIESDGDDAAGTVPSSRSARITPSIPPPAT